MQCNAAGVTLLRYAAVAIGLTMGVSGLHAQDERISWSVIGTGGVVGASDGTVLFSATVGQPVIGPTGDPTLQLQQGFWVPIVNGPASVGDEGAVTASTFKLRNYPNPVSSSTTISYVLSERSRVKLEIVDLAGRTVKMMVDQTEDAGEQQVEWNGTTVNNEKASSGMYFYILTVEPLFGGSLAGDGIRTERRKLVVVR